MTEELDKVMKTNLDILSKYNEDNKDKGKNKEENKSIHKKKNCVKDLFTHTAAGQLVKYLKLEKSLGLDIVEQIKQKIAISNNNSYLEIANKVINNPFPCFLKLDPILNASFLNQA